jgi:hypothetical protein
MTDKEMIQFLQTEIETLYITDKELAEQMRLEILKLKYKYNGKRE